MLEEDEAESTKRVVPFDLMVIFLAEVPENFVVGLVVCCCKADKCVELFTACGGLLGFEVRVHEEHSAICCIVWNQLRVLPSVDASRVLREPATDSQKHQSQSPT